MNDQTAQTQPPTAVYAPDMDPVVRNFLIRLYHDHTVYQRWREAQDALAKQQKEAIRANDSTR